MPERPVWHLIWRLLLSPVSGIPAIAEGAPPITRVILTVAAASLVRGLLDGLWYYSATGRLTEVLPALGRPAWYTLTAGPFLLMHIAAALALWIGATVVLHTGAVLLAGKGRIRHSLSVLGLAQAATTGASLLNFAHLWWPLPDPGLSPALGVGQFLALLWFGLICYRCARSLYGLRPLTALLAATVPFLTALWLYLTAAGLLFRLVPVMPGDWQPVDWLARKGG